MMHRVIIRGRVQRVFFRRFVREEALKLGLSGWVRNCSDGSVEILCAGSAQHLHKMIQACSEGPPLAAVESVEDEEVALAHYPPSWPTLHPDKFYMI